MTDGTTERSHYRASLGGVIIIIISSAIGRSVNLTTVSFRYPVFLCVCGFCFHADVCSSPFVVYMYRDVECIDVKNVNQCFCHLWLSAS